MRIKSIMFFPNGNIAVFDDSGKQVPEMQNSYLLETVKSITAKGGQLTEQTEIVLPNGKHAELFRTEFGWNWIVR